MTGRGNNSIGDDFGDTMDCHIYRDAPKSFRFDHNSLDQSFFFTIQPANSLLQKFPSYAQVKGNPLAVLPASGLNECWGKALSLPNVTTSQWWYLAYDSNLTVCSIYPQEITGLQVVPATSSSTSQNLVTFWKSLPTYNVDYYSYDYFWVNPAQVKFPLGAPTFSGSGPTSGQVLPKPPRSTFDECLATCTRTGCAGIIHRPQDGQCAILDKGQLKAIYDRDQSVTTSAPSILSWQVFVKARDLSFLNSTKDIYGCFNESVYDKRFSSANQSNPLVNQGQLDRFQNSLVNGTNFWLEPHGPGFTGAPQPTIANGGLQQQQKPPTSNPPTFHRINKRHLETPRRISVKASRQAIVFVPNDIGSGKFPGLPDLPGLPKTLQGGIQFVPGSGGMDGLVLGGLTGQDCGSHCTPPPVQDLPCELQCEITPQPISRFLETIKQIVEISRRRNPQEKVNWSALSIPPKMKAHPEFSMDFYNNNNNNNRTLSEMFRAPKCQCKSSPYPYRTRSLKVLKPTDFNNPLLQKQCNPTDVDKECPICCATAHESKKPEPTCTCKNGVATWKPREGDCVPTLTGCTLGNRTWSSNAAGVAPGGSSHGNPGTGSGSGSVTPAAGQSQIVVRIPVKNCNGQVYYGVGFQINRKIPLYSMYKFIIDQPSRLRNGNFAPFPCTEEGIAGNQTEHEFYRGLKLPPGGTVNRGHLTPDGDMKQFADSQRSTYWWINVAPQDKTTNLYWSKLETEIRKLLNSVPKPKKKPSKPLPSRGGWIMTGTCYDDSANAGQVPDCFWKIVCTKDEESKTTVAAFIADNSWTTDQNSKKDRQKQVYTVRNQQDLVASGATYLGPITIEDLWDEFGEFYDDADSLKDFKACKDATAIKFPDLSFPTMKQDNGTDPFELFHFWNNSLFGGDFDPNVEEEPMVPTSVSGSPPPCSKKVVGYVTSWSNVPFTQAAASYLTHAILAFVQMKEDGSLVFGSPDPAHSTNPDLDRQKTYARMYELRNAKLASGGRLKTIFAVGGWENSQYFSSVIASDSLTQNFVSSALDILDYFNMDGIDIDFEYPVTGGAHNGTQADRANYVSFLKTLRSNLDTHAKSKGRSSPYILTIAGAAGVWVLEPGFDLTGITSVVDWINVMTYDYFGAWDSQWGAYTGPIAPLYYGAPPNYSGKLNVDFTMKKYLCNITNPDKLVMGLGFYGRFWNNSGSPVNASNPLWRKATPNAAGKFDGGYLPYRDIESGYLNNNMYTKVFDQPTQTPFLYQSPTGGFLLAYEDKNSIGVKVQYAASKGFAGVMLWTVDLDDDDNTMLRTASSSALCQAAESLPYKCPPNTGQRWWTLEDSQPQFAGMCDTAAAPLQDIADPVKNFATAPAAWTITRTLI